MWKAALLTLGLLVSLVDRVRCNDGHPSFYGVKLCGREFVRAVIFTCGGFRWRRNVGDSGMSVCVRLMNTGLFSVMCHDLPFLCRSSSWRRGLRPMEHKCYPSPYPRAGSCWVPCVERSNIEWGTCGCWIQPLSSLTNLRGGAGGSTECR